MFYGLDWIATVPPTVRLTAQRFGPERANLVFGWIFAGHQLGAATAAFGAGLSRTLLAQLSAGILRRRRAAHHRLAIDAGDCASAVTGGGGGNDVVLVIANEAKQSSAAKQDWIAWSLRSSQ